MLRHPRLTVLTSSLLAVLVTALGAAPRRALAQDVLDAKAARVIMDLYVSDLDTLHAKIVALATAIPAEKFSWRPSAGVRSVSEALMHIASEWYYYTPMSIAAKAPADFGVPKETLPKLEKITGKAEVLAQLDKSWTYCRSQLASADVSKLTGKYKPWGVSLPEAAFSMTDDLHEHLGQLIAYARSVGAKPPWTK
ncbi:MAG: DinB family protein [Gemmatimonadota bacterium]|nr:DinB family protein [Gemmatimonadota bacterium]